MANDAERESLRKLLWAHHGHLALNDELGQLHCRTCGLDYRQATPEQIAAVYEDMRQEAEDSRLAPSSAAEAVDVR